MTAPHPSLDFWFEFASTYSYLSAARITDLAENAGVAIRWRPFLLGPIFAAQGWSTSPFTLYPAKGAYMWQDVGRIAAARGLPFQKPARFPQNGLVAARVALAALAADKTSGAAFCVAVYRAQFGDGADITDPDVLRGLLTQTGAAPRALDQAGSPGIKQLLRKQTEAAQARGIFGAPSFTVGDALYWGDDRLDQAMEHARSMDAGAG